MRGVLMSLVLVAVPIVQPAAQQRSTSSDRRWAVGLLVGSSSFSGAAEATSDSGERITFAPYRPSMTGLRITRGGNRLRLAASVQFGRPGLAIRGAQGSLEDGIQAEILLVGQSVYHLWSFAAGASTRLVRLAGDASLRPSLGLELQRWSASGSPALLILGGEAGLGLEVPLTGPFVAELSGAVGFTPSSPFRREDVPEEFRLRSTWRRTVAAAVYWRF